jgi:hypothetical protein
MSRRIHCVDHQSLSKDKEIYLEEAEMNKILKYLSLAHLVEVRIYISEILLYQHLVSLIDIDHGGSIDAKELQFLISAIGSNIQLRVRIILCVLVILF